MLKPLPAALIVFAAAATPPVGVHAATVAVDPQTTRAIAGHADFERGRYLTLCDQGTAFDRRMQDGPEVYQTLIREYGARFGRRLGLVKWPARNAQEDPARPGFVDYVSIENELRPQPSSDRMQSDLGPNLGVALHGKHNAYPAFMGKVEAGEADGHGTVQYLPENLTASAELAATVLERGYTDFDRPAFFEPVNEPHWRFMLDDHLARWHLAMKDAVQARTPDVKVGGPCLSVSYFYRQGYQSFTSIQNFMEQTGGTLDFYSFHVYDYLRWQEEDATDGGEVRGDYGGAIQTGLPLEGVLDLVQNHAVNTLGREVDLVISEHGGYNGFPAGGDYDGEPQAERLVAQHHPDATGFDRELKKRSIVNSLMIGSVVANTLTFMDHPHVVQKAVPFILPTTWNWGPKYYAQLYVAHGYTDETRWVPTHLVDFYRFFRGVDGRRVKALCDDPDVQARAVVDGTTLYLALNNQSYRPEAVMLSGVDAERVVLRRMGRNTDFTGYYREDDVATPAEIVLAGREAVMLVAELPGDASAEARRVDERVCYADRITQPVETATFTVLAPTDTTIDYAQLRIGLERPVDAAKTPTVTLNGQTLEVPLEDCADRMTNEKQYATTKLIPVDPALLKAQNTVTVRFKDGDAGHVGTVVLRAAVAVEE